MKIKKRFLALYFIALVGIFLSIGLYINALKYNSNFINFSKDYFNNNITYAQQLANNLDNNIFLENIDKIKNNLNKAKNKQDLKEINNNLNSLIITLLHKTYSIQDYKNYLTNIYNLDSNEDYIYSFDDENGNFEKVKNNFILELEKAKNYSEIEKSKQKFEEYVFDKTYSKNIITIKGLLTDIKAIYIIVENNLEKKDRKKLDNNIDYLNKLFSDISYVKQGTKVDFFEKTLLINEFYSKYEEVSSQLYFLENLQKNGETPDMILDNQIQNIKQELVTNAINIKDADDYLQQVNLIESQMINISNPDDYIALNNAIVGLSEDINFLNIEEPDVNNFINYKDDNYSEELQNSNLERLDYLIKKLNKVLLNGENKTAKIYLEKANKTKNNSSVNNVFVQEEEINLLENEIYNSGVFDDLLYGEYANITDLILTEKAFMEDNIDNLLERINSSNINLDNKNYLIEEVKKIKEKLENIDINNKENVEYIYELSGELFEIDNKFSNILFNNHQK
ncbi:MAG: hypothetical protein N4A38_00860 [Candidatus Gracilibacteria bacterium]|nr:hypothetical protein [Candidatus Gracilibacteria bacterium]